MRRVLAKTVTRGERRFDTVLSCEPVGRHARGENRGLGVLSEQQLFFRSFETQRAQRLTEGIVSLGERLAADRMARREALSHPDLLGSLTGKYTGNHRTRSEGLRPSDSPTRSLARRFVGALRSRGSRTTLSLASGRLCA